MWPEGRLAVVASVAISTSHDFSDRPTGIFIDRLDLVGW